MKRIILLLFSLCCLTAYGQEALFSYRSNGDIISRSDYVKPFGKFRYIKGITPFILKQERTESAPNGDTYQIKCEKFRNWENDPGDLHTIVIRHEGKQIFSPKSSNSITEVVTEIPRCFSISIQSDVAVFLILFDFTAPATWICPPKSSSFSVSEVLPASGCAIIANVLLLSICWLAIFRSSNYSVIQVPVLPFYPLYNIRPA